MPAREGRSLPAQARGERGVLEDALAAGGDVLRRAAREEQRLLAVHHVEGDVGARQDHGPARGEELGQLGREAVIVEGPRLPGLDEDVGDAEEPREPRLGDEAEVEHVGRQVGRQALQELGPVEARAHEAGRRPALVERADRGVEVAHLGLVGEGVAAREDDDLLVRGQSQLAPQLGVRLEGPQVRGVDPRLEEGAGHAGRHELPEALDDHGRGVREPQERAVAHRVGEAVREDEVELPESHGAKLGRGALRVARDQELLVVLQVDDQPGGARRAALVGDDELAHAFPGRPRVDDVGGPAPREYPRLREDLVAERGDERRVLERGERVLAVGDRHGAGVALLPERLGKAPDVVQAVGRVIAVIDEEDVHRGGSLWQAP